MRIGITGYATSGKDEVAKVLVDDFDFARINMSDALNKYLCILDPWVEDGVRYKAAVTQLGYDAAKARFPEVRRLLQSMGTEVGRAIDPDMWVKEVEKLAAMYPRVVTTGIRFHNEIAPGMILVHVSRPGVGPLNDHPSEDLSGIIGKCDWRIYNEGTLEDLRATTTHVMNMIMEGQKR